MNSDANLQRSGSAQPSPQQPDIDWNYIRQTSDQHTGRTLYIFDTCFAVTGALRSEDTEYLAAAGVETRATLSLDNCLTNRLAELLKYNIQTKTRMTVAQYAATLTSEMGSQGHELDTTPVYVPARTKPSSILTPLTANPADVQEKLGATVKSRWSVLVTFRMMGSGTVPEVEQFKKYLLSQVPSNIAEIQVEAAYKANSQLLLVKMPIEVWSCLKEDDNVNFVSFVQGGNTLAGSGGVVLAERPRGVENVPGSSRQGSK